jgi:hypothetical protein
MLLLTCVSFLHHTLELMFPLYLIFHVKVYSFYLSLVRVCTEIFIYKLIPYHQGCVLSLLIKFDITSQKGEKELKGIFLI